MSHEATLSRAREAALPMRALAFAYGVIVYLAFFATFLYFIAFVGGIAVPKPVERSTYVLAATAVRASASRAGQRPT